MWQDLRHGLRMLAKNPAFTAVAVLSIAVGVGANAAMFSLADSLVLRPLQVPRASEVVALGGNPTAGAASTGFGINRAVSFLDYRDVRDRARSFEGLFAYRVILTGFSRRAGEPTQNAMGLAVSGNFFRVLGVQPRVGRTFRDDEDAAPGRDPVVMLSYAAWTERFNSDPGVVGRQVRIGGRDLTVIGVTPESFTGMHLVLHPIYYLPLAMAPALTGATPGLLDARGVRSVTVRGRLVPGVSLEQAQQEVAVIAADLERTYPDTNKGFQFLVRSDFRARMEERGPSAPGAFMLITLAVVVLLVACANVAGLLISRAPERARELAVRMAIGGGRIRVVRQLLTEGALLGAAGGLVGLGAGYAVLRYMQSGNAVISDIGVRLVASLDGRALTVGLVAAAASALASSLVPAWMATRSADLTSSLRPGASSATRARLWGRHGLVVGQVALSLMMLIVAVFVYRSFAAEFSRPGFETTRMVLVGLNPELAGYDPARTLDFYQRLVDRARALPSVRVAGLTSVVPLNQDTRNIQVIVPEGFELPPDTETISVSSSRIDEGYLDAMRIPIVAGRAFRQDDDADAPLVTVVNQALAARYWPGQDPIGKRLRLQSATGPWATVVGVAADSKYNWIGEASTPFVYLPYRQHGLPNGTLLVATTGASPTLVSPLRDILRELDADLPTSPVRTMEEFYEGAAVRSVSGAVSMVGYMGLMGLGLSLVGLYSLMAYAVARRTREIGIRMAIGAQPGAVMRMVLRHGGWLVSGGVALGVVGSVGVGGLLRGILPGRGNVDLAAYAIVVPALIAVTLLAAYLPARRAAHIDPLKALRQE
jgi:macrolide transport system ATP-binding/permease protein